jgi:uncharacterized protein YbjQ (UPF0145 family)
MNDLIIFLILMAVGYAAGTWAEKKHYRSIEERERRYLNLPAVTIKDAGLNEADIVKTELVYGNAVISVDYFKRILALMRNIFGGSIKSYETLIDRARREALLRMKESAQGAAIIVNVRLETSSIGKNAHKKGVGCVEVIAYGTALTLRKT